MSRPSIQSEGALLVAALVGLALGAAVALLAGSDTGRVWRATAGVVTSASLASAIYFGLLARRRERTLRRLCAAHAQEIADAERIRCELEACNDSVSHDLRSPLAAIINFTVILSEDSGNQLGQHGRDQVSRIGESASAAVAILEAASSHLRMRREATLRPTNTGVSAAAHREIETS